MSLKVNWNVTDCPGEINREWTKWTVTRGRTETVSYNLILMIGSQVCVNTNADCGLSLNCNHKRLICESSKSISCCLKNIQGIINWVFPLLTLTQKNELDVRQQLIQTTFFITTVSNIIRWCHWIIGHNTEYQSVTQTIFSLCWAIQLSNTAKSLVWTALSKVCYVLLYYSITNKQKGWKNDKSIIWAQYCQKFIWSGLGPNVTTGPYLLVSHTMLSHTHTHAHAQF